MHCYDVLNPLFLCLWCQWKNEIGKTIISSSPINTHVKLEFKFLKKWEKKKERNKVFDIFYPQNVTPRFYSVYFLFPPAGDISNKCRYRLHCYREISNNINPTVFWVYQPRKDPDYAPLTKVAKHAPKSPQNIILPYHQLKETTLSMLYARDGIKNWWFYQLVLGIVCSLKNLPYFLLDQDNNQVFWRTPIFIIMQSDRLLKLEHQISIIQVYWNY